MEKLVLSKSELSDKTIMEYLMEKYDKVEFMRGYSYKLTNKWVDVLTEDDERRHERRSTSFYRCFWGGKLGIDTSSIKKMIGEYLKDNEDMMLKNTMKIKVVILLVVY